MGKRPVAPEAVIRTKVVAIARGVAPDRLLEAAGALVDAGIPGIEVTLDSRGALQVIPRLRDRYGEGVCIGAGTVMTLNDAKAAVDAGAEYLISPHTNLEVVEWAAANGVPAMPGALTPTEVVRAWDAGAAVVKIFPAGPLGPAHLKGLKGPLSEIRLLPTGGIDASNARAYLDAGAVAVGVGSWLLGDGDPARVASRAEELQTSIGPVEAGG